MNNEKAAVPPAASSQTDVCNIQPLIQCVNATLAAALGYTARGYYVMSVYGVKNNRCTCGDPNCEHPGKHPACKNGVKDSTRYCCTIRKWFNKNPDLSVGIAGGGNQRLLVVDLDIKGDPVKVAQAKEALDNLLPDCVGIPTASTPSGGEHYYLTVPPGTILKNTVRVHGLPIDVRFAGAYVVAPSGAPDREWINPLTADLPEAPAALIQWLKKDESSTGDKKSVIEKLRDGIHEGEGRNTAIYKLAVKCLGEKRPAPESRSICKAFNQEYCKPPLAEAELKTIFESALKSRVATKNQLFAEGEPALNILSDVETAPVNWLWNGRIPRGKIIICDGDPGTGKSLFTADLAARISTNGIMPDGSEGITGTVLMLSAEDDPGDTIKPRILAAGGDVSKIIFLEGFREEINEEKYIRPPTLEDIPAIKKVVDKFKPVLIVIDPLMAHLTTDSHRDSDVRRQLAPLAKLAQEAGAAILIIRHLNKMSGGNPIYRGGGSIGIIGACRSGLLLGKNPEAPDGESNDLILAVTKSNLCKPPSSIALEIIINTNGQPSILWKGESKITAEQLIGSQEDAKALGEAKRFLRSFLEDGYHPALECQKAAKAAGLADHTLRRAREKICKSSKTKLGDKWVWELLP